MSIQIVKKEQNKMMPDIEDVRAALRNRNIKVIATETGVDYVMLLRIANGKATNPSYATIKTVVEYIQKTALLPTANV